MPIQQQAADILFIRSYIKQLIEDANVTEDTVKLLQYYCWENPHLSRTVLSELLWQIVPDEREGFLEATQRRKNHYQKRAYQCIKCMVQQFSKCRPAQQLLHHSPELKGKWYHVIDWLHEFIMTICLYCSRSSNGVQGYRISTLEQLSYRGTGVLLWGTGVVQGYSTTGVVQVYRRAVVHEFRSRKGVQEQYRPIGVVHVYRNSTWKQELSATGVYSGTGIVPVHRRRGLGPLFKGTVVIKWFSGTGVVQG
ncbi:hypothetical protein HN011_006785 [Eciton burchellii]|nr:hypothetical protein HN011_006785 [Eciton burchellii]